MSNQGLAVLDSKHDFRVPQVRIDVGYLAMFRG